jgi:hypothetical protein
LDTSKPLYDIDSSLEDNKKTSRLIQKPLTKKLDLSKGSRGGQKGTNKRIKKENDKVKLEDEVKVSCTTLLLNKYSI